jgi:FMN phosphatase YigB (HAD superfamily)
MKQALLLDFDGVVLRNHSAHRLVGTRCQTFVQRQLNIKCPRKAHEMNINLYKAHGHSLIGLQKMGHTDLTVHEFNQHVYSNIPYRSLFGDLKETHKQDIAHIRNLLKFCWDQDIDVFFFSNAPGEWCFNIIELMGLKNAGISQVEHSVLKPESTAFHEVQDAMREYDKLVYVDDSFINFQHIHTSTLWSNVLMSNEVQDNPILIHRNMVMIYNLQTIQSILEHHMLPTV